MISKFMSAASRRNGGFGIARGPASDDDDDDDDDGTSNCHRNGAQPEEMTERDQLLSHEGQPNRLGASQPSSYRVETRASLSTDGAREAGGDVVSSKSIDANVNAQELELIDEDWSLLFGWQLIHFLSFFTGGSTFIAGSVCYLYPNWPPSATVAAVLYTIGSAGFLLVDLLEFVTFSSAPARLRVNIALSGIGSTWYLLGSAGFLPSLTVSTPWLGPWGFIIGSFFIGSSQLWKTHRIACGGDDADGEWSWRHILCHDGATQVGVELSAGIGAWFFFVSTLMYQYGDSSDASYFRGIVHLWIAGSTFFFTGSLFLGYRHFVMHK